MSKYLVLLIDGAADDPVKELGNKTPLEAAYKPNIDSLAKNATVAMMSPTPNGCKGGSDTGNMCVMGYDPVTCLTGRSPLEAAAMGLKMADNDVALRANIVTLSDDEPFENKIMIDYSADEITSEEAAQLIDAVKAEFDNDSRDFHAGFSYRHCLLMHNATHNMDLTPAHNITTQRIGNYLPKGEYSDELTAMIKRSYEILKNHPVNNARIARGLKPGNSIWLWGQGTKPALKPFKDIYGLNGAAVTAVDLVKGIAFLAGMQICNVEGATGNINTNFIGKAQAAIDAFSNGCDLVYLHLEAPDECGHRYEIDGKVKAIELIDKLAFAPVLNYLKNCGEPYSILITPDHPTLLSTRAHSSAPVPYLLYRSYQNGSLPADIYCERTAQVNTQALLDGRKLMGILTHE